VYSYHILAKDTADVILCSQARAKKDMMEAFLSEKKGRRETVFILCRCVLLTLAPLELFELFAGATCVEDEDMLQGERDDAEEDCDAPAPKKKQSKKRKSKSNTAATVDSASNGNHNERQEVEQATGGREPGATAPRPSS